VRDENIAERAIIEALIEREREEKEERKVKEWTS
jgi:hypothetical protein